MQCYLQCCVQCAQQAKPDLFCHDKRLNSSSTWQHHRRNTCSRSLMCSLVKSCAPQPEKRNSQQLPYSTRRESEKSETRQPHLLLTRCESSQLPQSLRNAGQPQRQHRIALDGPPDHTSYNSQALVLDISDTRNGTAPHQLTTPRMEAIWEYTRGGAEEESSA